MIRKIFSLVAALLRVALGVAAIAAIYAVIRNRMGSRRNGSGGPSQA